MCINKKVLGGLALGGLVLYLVAPNLIGAALPLLVLAICPLSMLFMMRGMSGNGATASTGGQPTPDTEIDAELADLRAEVDLLRAERDFADARLTDTVATEPPIGEPGDRFPTVRPPLRRDDGHDDVHDARQTGR